MASVEQVLNIARSQIGYTESPRYSNRTKYGAWFGMNGVAWCLIFQQWVFAQAGFKLPVKTGYTPTMADWYKRNKAWFKTPKPGDLVFYSFHGARVDHVGLVERVNSNGTITTIEGNTSVSGSQTNGGAVLRRVRSSRIVGYGRPAYSNTASIPVVGQSTPPEGPKLDLTHPAIYYKAWSPEAQWIPALVPLYATKHNAKGDPFRNFQLIPWAHATGPDPRTTPRDSIVVGMDFKWSADRQIIGKNGGNTVKLALDFFGIG